jgi:hypothetical protein
MYIDKSLKTLVQHLVSDPISCSDAVCDIIPFFLKLLHRLLALSLSVSPSTHKGIGKGTSSHGGGHSSVPITTYWPFDIYGGARETLIDPKTFPFYSHTHHFCAL